MPKHRADYRQGGPVHGGNPRHEAKHAVETEADKKVKKAIKDLEKETEKGE